MSYIMTEVQKYKIRFYGQSTSGTQARAWLKLYDAAKVVGRFGFYSPDVVETKQDRLNPSGFPEGHMSIKEIGPVLDMLRNEKPIYVHWHHIWKQAFLDTSSEPVGEEET